MKPEFFKQVLVTPIPKYIVAKIRRTDIIKCPDQKGLRMYSYLTTVKKELVKVTVAVKNHYKKWYCKQVAVHGVKSDKCFVRDMEFVYFGYGFRVGWYAESLSNCKKWFEDGQWRDAPCKYYNPWSILVNPDFVGRLPQYRYSAYQFFQGKCIIEYLRLYEKYPQAEYLLKLGFHGLYDSVTVLKRIVKDKKFCRWLIANKTEIISNYYYVGTIMKAYKTGKPLKDIQAFEQFKKNSERDDGYRSIAELFKGKELERFFVYLNEQGSNRRSYLDYLEACNYLGLDMSLPKNRFPHNFATWHDIRIDQYHAAKTLADEKERIELYKQFAAVAEKYIALQKVKAGYAIIIAGSPADLLREGDALKHCVGRMNYAQRMVRQESLIFFVRNAENVNAPFVTVEYSLISKKILQCYGYGGSKPDDAVLAFVNKTWLPYANRSLKKLAA